MNWYFHELYSNWPGPVTVCSASPATCLLLLLTRYYKNYSIRCTRVIIVIRYIRVARFNMARSPDHFQNSVLNLLLISFLENKPFKTSHLQTGGLVGGDRLSLLEKQHPRLHTIERLVQLLKHLSLKRSIIWPLIKDSASDCFHLFIFATRPIAQWGRMSSLCLPVSGAVFRMETFKWLRVKLKPRF